MIFKIYIEGGGETSKLKTECRRGFRSFFEQADLKQTQKMPSIVACGSRNDAYDAFCTALAVAKKLGQKNKQKYLPILLVDSEAAVSELIERWEHLKQIDGWDKPASAVENQIFLMVECMESWFLADRNCLKAFFGKGFNESSLPGEPAIEKISKSKVFSSLKMATRNSQKGEYGKGRHGFEILSRISPELVEGNSQHCKLLLNRLRGKIV